MFCNEDKMWETIKNEREKNFFIEQYKKTNRYA